MPGRPSLRTRALRAVVAGVLLQALYVTSFVLPGHAPSPNGLPVAVVGGGPAAQALDTGGFDVRVVADEAAARAAILDREVLGALTPERTLVASAASAPVAQLLARAAPERPVVDVRPLDPDDPRGATLNLFVLPLIVTGILAALVAGGMAPDLDVRGRVLVAAAMAFAGSLVTVAIVHTFVGALPGPFLALAGVTTLAVLALALVSGGLVGLLGQAGIALAFVVFLMLGSPASGLATAPELLPTPWAQLGHLLPPGAMGSALRGTAYFDGAGVAGPVAVLLGWCGLGVALHVLAARRRRAAAPARTAGAPAA